MEKKTSNTHTNYSKKLIIVIMPIAIKANHRRTCKLSLYKSNPMWLIQYTAPIIARLITFECRVGFIEKSLDIYYPC